MRIRLTKHQWERFSEITSAIGNLTLGSAVIPFFLGQSNKVPAFWGMVTALILWYISVWMAKKY